MMIMMMIALIHSHTCKHQGKGILSTNDTHETRMVTELKNHTMLLLPAARVAGAKQLLTYYQSKPLTVQTLSRIGGIPFKKGKQQRYSTRKCMQSIMSLL